ncbi:MAG: chitobiase/beta-hexosaminidase C-terminal domain-containing protein [Lachnospiraceae bacterium]|nr:chitobiase/beta-hexosaminidase C-terminal domain-containing protein [Lachnospiraceae bacterium]
MSLYLKDKIKNENSEKKRMSKWAKYSGKIYSTLGVLCVVIVVMCLVLGIPKWTQAAEVTNPTGWSDYPMADGVTDRNLGEWYFNQSSGSVAKLSDLTFVGTQIQDGEELPCAAIDTKEQLYAVLSGLRTTDVYDSDIKRSQRVIFLLTTDLSIDNRMSDNAILLEYYGDTYAGNVFSLDTFDGQGHSIEISSFESTWQHKDYYISRIETSGGGGNAGIQRPNIESVKYGSPIWHMGMMFGRVEDAVVRNLVINLDEGSVTIEQNMKMLDEGSYKPFLDLGIGVICGSASNTRFMDIEVNSKNGLKVSVENDGYSQTVYETKYQSGYVFAGMGGIVGWIDSGVTITRCATYMDIDVTNEGYIEDDDVNQQLRAISCGVGSIVGVVAGGDNNITSCLGNGEITGNDADIIYSTRDLFARGGIVGALKFSDAEVKLKDCVSTYAPSIGCMVKDTADGAEGDYGSYEINNCYAENLTKGKIGGLCIDDVGGPEQLRKNKYYRVHEDKEFTVTTGNLSTKKDKINEEDWGYSEVDNRHFLIHPYGSIDDPYIVDFGNLTIAEPKGEELKIEVSGDVLEWYSRSSGKTNEYTENAVAYLSITTDGTDPKQHFLQKAKHEGHTEDESPDNGDLTISSSVNYADTTKDITIKAVIKVVFNQGKKTEYNVWSPVWEKTYKPSNTYIIEPLLEVSKENESFVEFQETQSYPLGTTRLQLTARGEVQDMYYYFGKGPGLQLGSEDSDAAGTIKKETMMAQARYNGTFTLIEDMVKNNLSNQIYMYVLAYARIDEVEYYKLYEYDIVVFAKDELVLVSPDSGSKIPNGASVSFMVGNGEVNELPYDKMRVFVSKDKQKLSTLNGMSGVEIYGDKTGDGTKENPYYLLARVPVEGETGETFYIYIEPMVNMGTAPDGAVPYKERYGSFVQEYSYTIMEKAAGLEISPMTITTAQAGNPTSIPINEKVYMSSSGNSDIIVYNIEGENITPQMVRDDSTLNTLNAAQYTQVGKNAYYLSEESGQGSVLYVRNNNVWYAMDNAENLHIYQDGKLSFDVSYSGKTVLVSTMLFAYDYDYSDNVIYKYMVQEQNAVDAPIALLANGSSVTMNKVLNFHCGQNCVMYYTLDGKEPQITIDSTTGLITPQAGTYLYNAADGIAVTEEKGYSHGGSVIVKIMACPVQDTNATEMVYNNDLKSSEVVTFNYNIIEQNQVETPVAYPETTVDAVAEIVNGDRISLSCATSGAEIYYTTDGSTPVVKEENRYTNTIEVNGDYGGYFSVKAMAHKEGMKDSEVVTFLYKIADKETAGSVTAIPGTANKVIAGDKINLSVTISGAEIYYTTDGTTPEVVENSDGTYKLGESVLKYEPEKAIIVPEGTGYFIIHAIAVKEGMKNSEVAQFIYTYADTVGAPYGNPSAGTVVENTPVILQCAQKDAVIYYEIAYDGAKAPEPTTSSSVFSEQAPIVITRDTEIKAFAYYDRQASEIVTLKYVLAEKMEAPEASISSGAIVPSGTTISLPVESGKVYYTTDGSDPTDSSNAAVNIGTDVVITGKAGDMVIIKACTKESGATTSELVTFTYQISQYPGGVTTDTESGTTVASGTVVNLTTDVTGGTIYYTTGSGNPISAGNVGNSVVLSGKPGANVSVKAVAVAPNTTMNGSYAFFDYKLMEQLASPSASIKDGTSLTEKSSVVLKANQGKIYYTIDGREPTKADYEYTAPIVVTKNMTIKAIAIEEGYENSEVSSFSYAFAEQIEKITPSIPDGTVESGQVIKLSCNMPDVKIYYTTDGTEPVPGAEGVFLYEDSGISVYRSVNIKAIAVKSGMCNSELISLNYSVDEVPIEIEREKVAAEKEEAGLKPLDVTNLEARRLNGETNSNGHSVVIEDVISDTLVSGNNTAISNDAKLRAKEISVPYEAKKEIKNLLGKEYEVINNYDFALYENGSRVQPEGEVEIGIPIPEGYENADVMIVYINENNGVTVHNTRREGNYAYAKVSHFSSYAIAGAQLEDSSNREFDLILIMSVAAGAFVLMGIGMIIRTAVKRKRY